MCTASVIDQDIIAVLVSEQMRLIRDLLAGAFEPLSTTTGCGSPTPDECWAVAILLPLQVDDNFPRALATSRQG
jgi:hypothetical protein